jgi:phosphate:Na+ symporter
LALVIFNVFKGMIQATSPDIAQQVANSHTIFNVLSAIIFLPITNLYVKFLEKIVPDKQGQTGPLRFIDPRLLDTPVAAIGATVKEIQAAAELARRMIKEAIEGLLKDDSNMLGRVQKLEGEMNELQQQITEYLIALSNRPIGTDISGKIPALVHCINDIERVGDHAENLAELANEKVENNLPFSEEAVRELRNLLLEIDSMIEETLRALDSNDPDQAAVVLAHENRFDDLTDELRARHIRRLEEGRCKIQSGVIFLDIVANLERAADHLENVAVAVMHDFGWGESGKMNTVSHGVSIEG